MMLRARARTRTHTHTHTRGKAIGDSSPVDQNSQDKKSRTIKGGDWSLPRPQISPSQSQETSVTTYAQKDPPGGQRGVMLTNARLSTGLFSRIHLG